jgi:hypothetical protein
MCSYQFRIQPSHFRGFSLHPVFWTEMLRMTWWTELAASLSYRYAHKYSLFGIVPWRHSLGTALVVVPSNQRRGRDSHVWLRPSGQTKNKCCCASPFSPSLCLWVVWLEAGDSSGFVISRQQCRSSEGDWGCLTVLGFNLIISPGMSPLWLCWDLGKKYYRLWFLQTFSGILVFSKCLHLGKANQRIVESITWVLHCPDCLSFLMVVDISACVNVHSKQVGSCSLCYSCHTTFSLFIY